MFSPPRFALLACLWLGLAAGPAGAGSYNQTFDAAADGATALGDATAIASDTGVAQVKTKSGTDRALRLTALGTGNTHASFKLYDLDPGKEVGSFDVTFNVCMNATNASTHADGWSFSFGAIPSGTGNGEAGFPMTNGLSIGWDTYVNSPSDPISIEIYGNGISIANFPQTFLFDTTYRPVSIHWDNVHGLTLIYNGVTICDGQPLPGFVPTAGNFIGFSARTGGVTEDVLIDDLHVTTAPNAPIETGGPIISEFVADSDSSYKDEDNDKSDWIEIYNGQNASVNLNGWHLTNDSSAPAMWTLPNVTLGAYQYLIVFADGKNRILTSGQLHTGFTLSKTGGYVALTRADNSIVSSYVYGPQVTDIAYGELGTARTIGYLDPPTPLAKNIATQAAGPPAEAVVFSRAGGIITGSVPLSLAAPVAAGSVVRYSLSQVAPYSSSAIYSTPFSISTNTTVRARVFTPGLLPGPVTSRTFIALDSTLQNYNGSGVPFSSNLPVVVMDSFGVPVDSYTNAANRPYRPTYAVVIAPDTVTGRASLTGTVNFQGRSGTHVRGESSAGFAQKQYAWKTLDESDVNGQDAAILGMPAGSTWVLYAPAVEKSLMRDFLTFEVMRAFRPNDYSSPKDRFCEVLFNQAGGTTMGYGSYHGVFLLKEKIKVDSNRLSLLKQNLLTTTSPSITGGYIFRKDKTDVDSTALTSPMVTSGLQSYDPDTLNSAQQSYLNSYLTSFEAALPPATGGTPPYNYPNFIDSDSFIDVQWFVEWTKQIDGYVYSTYFNKDRNGILRAGPIWDFNIALGNANYGEGQNPSGVSGSLGEAPTGWDYDAPAANSKGVGQLWYPRLHRDPTYHVRHWDRYWALRKGPLATATVQALIDTTASTLADGYTGLITNNMASTVQNPAARHYRLYQRLGVYDWPNPSGFDLRVNFNYPQPTSSTDSHYSDWYTLSEVGYLKNWLTLRLAWLDDQNYDATSKKIYRPPNFSVASGRVSAGQQLSITPYSGTAPGGYSYPATAIYYTTDGTDPRGSTGAAAGTLLSSVLTLNTSGTIQARMYDSTTASWSPITSATYLVDAAPAAAGNLIVSAIMYNPVAATSAESKTYEYLELMNVGASNVDLTGVSIADAVLYTFSSSTLPLPPGGRIVIPADVAGFAARYGSPAGVTVAPGKFSGSLANEGELVTLKAANLSIIEQFTYLPTEPWPVDANGGGYSLVRNSPYSRLDPSLATSWRSSAQANGAPGQSHAATFTGQVNGDANHNGIPDFLEYALGNGQAGVAAAPTAGNVAAFTVNSVTKNYAKFVFIRSLNADATCTVELSENLSAWDSSTASVTYVSSHNNGDGTATVTCRSALPIDDTHPKFYFRVRATP